MCDGGQRATRRSAAIVESASRPCAPRRMRSSFRRELTDYVEYHRDPWNCAMHVFGIVFLFLAAVLPLSLWSFTVSGVEINAAVIAVLPVLFYWFLLDLALGAGIFCG